MAKDTIDLQEYLENKNLDSEDFKEYLIKTLSYNYDYNQDTIDLKENLTTILRSLKSGTPLSFKSNNNNREMEYDLQELTIDFKDFHGIPLDESEVLRNAYIAKRLHRFQKDMVRTGSDFHGSKDVEELAQSQIEVAQLDGTNTVYENIIEKLGNSENSQKALKELATFSITNSGVRGEAAKVIRLLLTEAATDAENSRLGQVTPQMLDKKGILKKGTERSSFDADKVTFEPDSFPPSVAIMNMVDSFVQQKDQNQSLRA